LDFEVFKGFQGFFGPIFQSMMQTFQLNWVQWAWKALLPSVPFYDLLKATENSSCSTTKRHSTSNWMDCVE